MPKFPLGRLSIAAVVAATGLPAAADAARTAPAKRHVRPHRAAAAPNTEPSHDETHATTGNASFYGHHLDGRRTASGERYDPEALTAAHRTLPLGTKLKVVNPKNDRSVVVTVNDRGPHHGDRMLDVSSAAAEQLGMRKSGVTRVHAEVLKHDGATPVGRASATNDAGGPRGASATDDAAVVDR